MAIIEPTAQQVTGNLTSLYTTLTGSAGADSLLGMSKWGGAPGTGAMLSYSFPTLASQFDLSDVWGAYGTSTGSAGALTAPGFAAFDADQQAATALALAAFANVANLGFTLVAAEAGGGTLRFNFTDGPAMEADTAAYSVLPMDTAESADTFFNATYLSGGFAPGTQNFLTLTHELGHALGLKHPFETATFGSPVGWPRNDTTLPFTGSDTLTGFSSSDTVMAYNDLRGRDEIGVVQFAPTTLMRFDIQALQYIYGPNMDFNAGDTVYSFLSDQQVHQTIWDGGGNDTIAVSGPGASRIDLTPGSWSEIGAPLLYSLRNPNPGEQDPASNPQTLFIYDTVTIENAAGGAGDDEITGNAADNRLTGNAGFDALDGGAGFDVAVYDSPSGQARVDKLGGVWVVTDKSGANGTDAMINVEQLQFADKLFDLVNLPRTEAPTYGKTGSFLFDAVYYLLDNAELVPAFNLATAAGHYLQTGAAQGKAPNSWFDADYYANKWADLQSLDLDAATLFLHYNLFGVWEGRAAGPKFDAFDGNRYLAENPDVAAYVDAHVADFLNSRSNGAIAHFVIYGSNEQREVFDMVGQAIGFDYSADLFGA
ncbi:MAG: M10 family metallopeptidase C-terminal domain-containing protein [Burkholderiaceae bacterium]|nr:M10 family metallopeptidase C-terminal domain-containing protein [Burkholderiaceae bacterium]